MHADDTTLLSSLASFGHNIETKEYLINAELSYVIEWLNINKLSLNKSTSKYMIFHVSNKYIQYLTLKKRGGGVAVLHKSGLKLKKVSPRGHVTHFEHADYHVMIHGVTFRLCIIYRPPPSKRNGLVNTVFFDQWSAYLDIVMLDSHNIIITGDLNFHLDNPAELDVRRFSETLADRGMTQLVKFPTHKGGHILDVVIVRETGSIISALPTVYDPCLCDKQRNISGDHMAVRFAVHASKPARLRKVITFRRLRQFCVSDFAEDIASSMDLRSDGSVTELVLHYN